MRGNDHRAFSLVEILVCIAVCAILAALVMGGIGRAREKAEGIKCTGNLRQIGSAFLLYASEHNGSLPTMFEGTSPAPETKYWNYIVGPYLNLRDDQGAGLNALLCPSKSKDNAPFYGANYPTIIALDQGQTGASWLDIGSRRLGHGVDQRTFLLADATSAAVYSPLVWDLDRDEDNDGVNDSNASFPYNRLEFRHAGRANFFLLNGAIVSLSTAQWGKNLDNIWGTPR